MTGRVRQRTVPFHGCPSGRPPLDSKISVLHSHLARKITLRQGGCLGSLALVMAHMLTILHATSPLSSCLANQNSLRVFHWTLSVDPRGFASSTLRLRGGHRMPNEKKRNAKEKFKTSRRIHSMGRPQEQKRRAARMAENPEEETKHEDHHFNITDFLLKNPPRKLRYWETSMSEKMNKIHEFKKRCPGVWREERKCRADNEAGFVVAGWRTCLENPEDDEQEAWFRDHDEEWIKKRAIAHYNLAMCYEVGYGVDEVNVEKSFEHFKAAAEMGHPEGMCNAGACYLSGHGVVLNEELGFAWVKKAAEAGSFEGQVNFGLCYRRGVGVAKDPVTAVKWFNASANNKHPDGVFAMAMCYQQGYGVEPNPSLCVTMLSKNVDKYHHLPSKLSLGECFLEGVGVEEDREMGLKLVAMAAQDGMEEAQDVLQQYTT